MRQNPSLNLITGAYIYYLYIYLGLNVQYVYKGCERKGLESRQDANNLD